MNSDNEKLNNSESEEYKDQIPDDRTPDAYDTNPEHQDVENIPETESDSAPDEKEPAPQKEIQHKNITRSKKNRIFLGVCSGLADYFDTDPLFFRLAFIISVIFGFWGILFYLILGIVMPEASKSELPEQGEFEPENHKMLMGSSLILLGIFLIVKNTRLFHFFQVWNVLAKYLVPAALVAAGIFLLFRKRSNNRADYLKLYRSVEDKKIAGVCGGLGEYLNVDPTIIRIIWLIFVLSSFGIGVLVYLLFVIMVPEKQEIIDENKSDYH